METRGLEPAPDGERAGHVRELFPTWVAANISVPLLTTVGGAGTVVLPMMIPLIGMLLINSMSMHPADFTAQTLGIRVPRAWAVGINAVISLVFGFLQMMVLYAAPSRTHEQVPAAPVAEAEPAPLPI